MKKGIHPKLYTDTKVTCACGNTFTTQSTLEEIHVDLCSECHPFFTGKQKFVDAEGRIEKFNRLVKASQTKKTETPKKKGKAVRERRDNTKTPSLKDLLTESRQEAQATEKE